MSRYFPPLSFFIKPRDIPGDFGALEQGINALFSKLYVKNLGSDIRGQGQDHFFSLKLVSQEKLALQIPGGLGLSLVFNPSHTSGATSEIPLNLRYTSHIQDVISDFELNQFSFSQRAFFDIILSITGVSYNQFFVALIQLNTKGDSGIDPFEVFVNDFHSEFNPSTQLVTPSGTDPEQRADDLLNQLQSNGNNYNIVDVAFALYFDISNFNKFVNKLQIVFSEILGSFTIEDIKSYLIPEIALLIKDLDIAIEFPRNVLKPVDANNQVIPNKRSKLSFNVGSLSFHSSKGFGFQSLSTFTFDKSEILNTGFTLSFQDAKVDLSRSSSIKEVKNAGYPRDFLGVYIKEATIGLPSILQQDQNYNKSQAEVLGKNLILGTGGISGTVALDDSGNNLGLRLGSQDGFAVELDTFSIEFQQNAIIGSSIGGTMIIPNFKNGDTGGNYEIPIDAAFDQEGHFTLTANAPANLPPLKLPQVFSLDLDSLSLGNKENPNTGEPAFS